MEGWFYGQYETGPWWASHSKVDHDNSNGDIVLQLAEVKDGFEDFEDLNNSGWSTWYFRLGGGRGWNARCKMDFAWSDLLFVICYHGVICNLLSWSNL